MCLLGYHEYVREDVLYLDATGQLTLDLLDFKRTLHYMFCVRHPYYKTPPLPIGHYITGSHNIESVRSFIRVIQEKERVVYQDGLSDPRLITTGYSVALIMACIKEFCKENLKTYINLKKLSE